MVIIHTAYSFFKIRLKYGKIRTIFMRVIPKYYSGVIAAPKIQLVDRPHGVDVPIAPITPNTITRLLNST